MAYCPGMDLFRSVVTQEVTGSSWQVVSKRVVENAADGIAVRGKETNRGICA